MTTALSTATQSVAFQQQVTDQRSTARFPLQATVVISLPGENRRCLFTKNISAGGMFVLSDEQAPEEGTKVGIELIVNDHFKFRTSGVVAHANETNSMTGKAIRGFGVRFSHLASERVEQLMLLIDLALEQANKRRIEADLENAT